MKSYLTKKNILLAALVIFILMQFRRIDKTNPPIEKLADFALIENPPAKALVSLKNACYDCHSNETTYPWYTNIAPFSWNIGGHVRNGRKKLNFSEWGNYDANQRLHKVEECIEEIEEKSMPLTTYAIMHSDARLSEEDRNNLLEWLNKKKHTY